MHILEDFEYDRMSPRESAKNGRMGTRGLPCKIFVNYEDKFEYAQVSRLFLRSKTFFCKFSLFRSHFLKI